MDIYIHVLLFVLYCHSLSIKSFVVTILTFTVHNMAVRRPDGDTVVCCAYAGEDLRPLPLHNGSRCGRTYQETCVGIISAKFDSTDDESLQSLITEFSAVTMPDRRNSYRFV